MAAPGGDPMKSNVSKGIALSLCLAFAACSGQKAPAEPSGSSGEQKGQYGLFYIVSVSRPVGGTVRSLDGKINCGTAGGLCAPAMYLWLEEAKLEAIPDTGMYFQAWAGDCSNLAPTCTLGTATGGADKWAAVVFNPPNQLGHGKIASPSVHAPMFFAFLSNDAGAARCTNCHGQGYQGLANAPSCNACHAAAGWANWQQSCSFCHGLKNPTTKAGYDFALHPEWAAPPDDVNGRLTGLNGNAVGAHQAHVAASSIRGAIACSECHVVPATAIHPLNHSTELPFGPLSKTGGANPTWDALSLTCGANYCHGNFKYGNVQGKAPSLDWMGSLTGCTTCHDMPPLGHMDVGSAPTVCSGCHSGTVNGDGTINVAGGLHINGLADVSGGGACDSCHGFPPASGAHLTHFGLTSAQGTSGYGDLSTLETRFPTATPTSAPAKYAFGCGNCHPINSNQHSMGSGSTTAKVRLYEAAAPAGSLKALNAPTATFDATSKTCSGVYCHSSGQAQWSGTIQIVPVVFPTPTTAQVPVPVAVSYPTYAPTPSWYSAGPMGCNGCHDNPPRYPTAGAGAPGANGHLGVDSYAWVVGHFRGIGAVGHADRHGAPPTLGPPVTSNTETAITCQTCHYDTTTPAAPGASRFYWLNTTGYYDFPITDPAQGGAVGCTTCHSSTGTSPQGADRVLPLRHVNGKRDVVFDTRTTIDPAISYLPAAPNKPTRPFFRASDPTAYWLDLVFNGSTASFYLDGTRSTYNQGTKTCTVACHNLVPASNLTMVWGAAFDWDCQHCHGNKYNY
jgi:predicted CxxxxCH...CXXCH cytochrome family protein